MRSTGTSGASTVSVHSADLAPSAATALMVAVPTVRAEIDPDSLTEATVGLDDDHVNALFEASAGVMRATTDAFPPANMRTVWGSMLIFSTCVMFKSPEKTLQEERAIKKNVINISIRLIVEEFPITIY